MSLPSLIGMVHLGPLPGSPNFAGDLSGVIDRALSDASSLQAAGFGALMVENFGDFPFFPGSVPPITITSLTSVVNAVIAQTDCTVGVNVLRNDGVGALAVAAATGATFIRVNVLSGLMYTDQGAITGQAAEVARRRKEWCPDVQIMADVMVKHASPPPGLTLEQAGLDTWERAGADALVISGSGTGMSPEMDEGRRLRKLLPDAPIFVGSGATVGNLVEIAEFANGVIVGSALKEAGDARNAVDAARAKAFRQAAASLGL